MKTLSCRHCSKTETIEDSATQSEKFYFNRAQGTFYTACKRCHNENCVNRRREKRRVSVAQLINKFMWRPA